ncbi:MAG: hypothetical protein AAF213_12890 [Pseudomonadota bacterium]
MKAALIAGVVVIAMAAGGFFFMKTSVTAATPETVEAEIAAPTGPTFVKLPRMLVPVFHNQRTVQFIELDLMLEVANDDVAEEFQENITLVQDKLISDLHSRFDFTAGERGGQVDSTRIKRKVAAAVASVIGREGIEDVLIQNIRQRRI